MKTDNNFNLTVLDSNCKSAQITFFERKHSFFGLSKSTLISKTIIKEIQIANTLSPLKNMTNM